MTSKFREEFEQKMSKKEEDHADALAKLEQERLKREEEFSDLKSQLE